MLMRPPSVPWDRRLYESALYSCVQTLQEAKTVATVLSFCATRKSASQAGKRATHVHSLPKYPICIASVEGSKNWPWHTEPEKTP
jgi:hypothetical protein